MKNHGERMARIEKLLAQVNTQHAEMLKIAERIGELRKQIKRELTPTPRQPRSRTARKSR